MYGEAFKLRMLVMVRGEALGCLTLALLLTATLFSGVAAAAEKVVFAVGSNVGLVDEDELTFGQKDATDFAQVMSKLGHVHSDNVHLLLEPTKKQFEDKLASVLASLHSDTMFLFYFSGHGSENYLHLGGNAIERSALRQHLQSSAARLKISIVDSCRGSKERGIHLGKQFELLDPKRYSGLIELQSTSRGESAFESRRLQGGRFTRHLLSGLRGAADLDQNGKVSLNESYVFAYERTLADSAATQTPSRSFQDLGGSGRIDMTTVIETDARLLLPSERAARYTIYQTTDNRGTVFAEAWTHPSHSTTIALPPGDFLVWRTVAGAHEVSAAEFSVQKNASHQMAASDFQVVSLPNMQRRGGAEMAYDVGAVSNYLSQRQSHQIEVSMGYRASPRSRVANGFGPTATVNYSWTTEASAFVPSVGASLYRENFDLDTHAVERDSLEGFVGVQAPAITWSGVQWAARLGATVAYTRELKTLRSATTAERSSFDSYGGLLQLGAVVPLGDNLAWAVGLELRVQTYAEKPVTETAGVASDSTLTTVPSLSLLTGVRFGI